MPRESRSNKRAQAHNEMVAKRKRSEDLSSNMVTAIANVNSNHSPAGRKQIK